MLSTNISKTHRPVSIGVEVDCWDWSSDPYLDKTVDITGCIKSYTFTKTIKSPTTQAQLVVTPNIDDKNILSVINPMDVIRIYEFGKLKFQGFVQNIGSSGEISDDGKPNRQSTIQLLSMGSIFDSAFVGVQMALFKDQSTSDSESKATLTNFMKASKDMLVSISDKLKSESGCTYSELIDTAFSSWFSFMDALGAKGYLTYFDTYFDIWTAVSKKAVMGWPRELVLFTGKESRISIWEVLEKLVESPMNELFFEEGDGRQIFIDDALVTLPERKTYLVFRPTPFNGTVSEGNVKDLFDNLNPHIEIDLKHFKRYDFNKTMDESYSFYFALPSVFNMSDIELIALGGGVVDPVAFGKYLFKPFQVQLFYARLSKFDATDKTSMFQKYIDRLNEVSLTLKNWFYRNDKYISGAITLIIPNVMAVDPGIGSKVSIETLDGEFYVEGVTHNFVYGSRLTSSLSVTRGWNYSIDQPLDFSGAIFRKGRSVF